MATSQRGACNTQSVPKTDEKKVAQIGGMSHLIGRWWAPKNGQQPQLLSCGNLKVSGSSSDIVCMLAVTQSIKLFGQDFDTHHIEEELLKWQIESLPPIIFTLFLI